jgi:hypothetical protein
MLKRAAAAFIFAAFIAACGIAPGCSKAKPANRDTKFTTLYAELMLLHEQDKFKDHQPDSLYQVHVRGLLSSYGMTEDEFRKKSAVLMKDDEAWRAFLSDVSLTFDSLRTARIFQRAK